MEEEDEKNECCKNSIVHFGRLAACFLVVCNIQGMILAIIFSALGGVFLFGAPLGQMLLAPVLESRLANTSSEFSSKVNISSTVEEIFDYTNNAGQIMMSCGIILLGIAIIGCCGACCSQKTCVFMYGVFAILIFMTLLAVAMVLQTDKLAFFRETEKGLLLGIRRDFQGFTGDGAMNTFTVLLTFIHFYFNCCGVENGEDFLQSRQWSRAYTIVHVHNNISYAVSYELDYPISCCKNEDFQIVDTTCPLNPTTENANIKIGCMKAIEEQFGAYFQYAAYGLFGFTFLMGLLIVAAVVKYIAIRKLSKVAPEEDYDA